jgi:hypothetical protein
MALRSLRCVGVAIAALGLLAASAQPEPELVYPEGEPRAGEPIQPVLEVRRTAAGVDHCPQLRHPPRVQLRRRPSQASPDDPTVLEAATWAVEHLRNLSDSGVYRSLSLLRVLDAATQEGVYHDNTLLTLELASPHFLDGAPTSTHRVIVMAVSGQGAAVAMEGRPAWPHSRIF